MDSPVADPAHELEELRGLLFGEEREQLAELSTRVLHTPTRTEDIAEILPQAVIAGHARGSKLALALQAPVNDCIKASVRDDPQPLVDALFPIIGPAIRRSIAEALRAFTESLNQTIEYSFSAKGLRWRLEAARSGVSFGDVVLKHTLRYRVDEVFLIHRGDGLLVEHAAQPGVHERDNDAVSGMLTAIQDFAHDAFQAQQRLQEITLGEHLLWLIHGPDAMLVCVIRGVPGADARALLTESLERIQSEYRVALANFDGDTTPFVGLKSELHECLVSEQKNVVPAAAATEKKSPSMPVMVIGLMAVAALTWLFASIWTAHVEKRKVEDFVANFATTPGIVVTDVARRDGRWHVRGMRDPLVPAPIPSASNLDNAAIAFEWTPYLSLDSSVVERRAREQLRLPPRVDLQLEDGVLVLSGRAPAGWIAAVRGNVFPPAGVTRIDSRNLAAE